MNKYRLKALVFVSLLLCSCTTTNNSSITNNVFKDKMWTLWTNETDSIGVYVSGGYFSSYAHGVGYYDNNKNNLFDAQFIINEYGSSKSYLKYKSYINGISTTVKEYRIEKFSDDENKNKTSMQLFDESNNKVCVLSPKRIEETEIKIDYLYRCSFVSQQYNFQFDSCDMNK